MNPPVLTRFEDGIGTISLNRPARLNALSREMMLALAEALETFASDGAVRVICLQGAGRAFSAGQDLSERDPRTQDHPFDLEAIQAALFHPVLRRIATMDKPVVARVNGLAAGAGASLALACDIVIAARSARFIQSFSNVGLSADAGAGWILVKTLGPARARAILMLGEALDADEAAGAGLIYRSVPDADLARETSALLDRLRAKPRRALCCIKRAVSAASEARDLDSYLAIEAALQGEAGRDPDYAEGVLSFLEKRTPVFR